MITVDGRRYGTRDEIAQALGPDVTADMVRNWARRDGLPSHLAGGVAYHPLDEAAAIEARKRLATRGRPRRVDVGGTLAA
ncbi:hypothetical protein [Phytohabitans aurantiacus]|uniref:HTH merR-type domain-containing protein n=1 Tax=Phytohabitans aurantiacus TaxID=3016789 RepID=A0ABQ5QRX1_9ACTN|nr:hypothetical protein [Phytohabitans aurantiacus]GLH97360.1 hypothetical protein Pa4123_26350 [Phytohabitans aurantiacus]